MLLEMVFAGVSAFLMAAALSGAVVIAFGIVAGHIK